MRSGPGGTRERAPTPPHRGTATEERTATEPPTGGVREAGGGHHDLEVILRRPTAVSLIVICATALAAGSAVALGQTPFPVYGETPTTSTPAPDPVKPAAPATPVAPAVPAVSPREAQLQGQIDTLRRQLARERAKHRRQLRAVRTTARAHVTRTLKDAVNQQPVQHAIALAAATFGVSEDRLRRVASCESTLNPSAGDGRRYVGLFQFGAPLWRATPYRDFSRTDPYAAALAASWAFARGMRSHWPVCGYR